MNTTAAGPTLTVGGVPLSDGHITSPTTITVANADSIQGEVTWLIDDKYAGKDNTAPYTWDASLTLGKHKAKARWITGLTTAEVTSEFTVQTDLNWVAPEEIREEPGKALENLWVTGDNRRPAVPGVYDWSKAGFGGGAVLPSDENVRAEAGCRIDAGQLAASFGVIPNDGADDTAGLQGAIDRIKQDCSPTGEYTSMSRITLPAGTLNITREIHVDADYLLIRGAGDDPSTGTRLEFLPDAATRYDTISADGTRWNPDAMNDGEANGGWIWPGRGLFRVQSRDVAPKYAAAYAAAPANRKDLYEGTINDHWTTGLTLRGKPGDPNYAGRKGDTVIHVDAAASFDNLKVGGLVNVMAANTMNFYAEMQALPTESGLDNLYMRQQIFMVTAGDPVGKTITLDKPLEYDVPVTSVSDGSAPIDGKTINSKLSPLVDAVVGVGFENLYITQAAPGLDRSKATDNYGNMDPAGAMHGIVFKWAANSWVKGVRTEMTGSHPVVTEDAASLSIIDNTFDGAWNKGKGGNGYLRGSRVWDSVYAGNTMRNLRHFTFQWSASGNVAIGNSSDADMNLHGGYERNNLFELNEVSTPYAHRPDNCWTNCGGEGSSGVDDTDWYPIWWGAGKKAVKWSGSTGPNNVFFNNHMRKQLGNGTTPYTEYSTYTGPGVIYQMGSNSSGGFAHLQENGTAISDWDGKETVDFTNGSGVLASRTDPGRSLFLNAPTLNGYGGPNPQPLRRTWGCSCWDGRGMVNTRLAADPINTASGSLMETFTDLSIAGVGETLTWGRTYNSLDPTAGSFGTGWTFTYNASVKQDPDGFFYFRDGTGSQSQYTRNADGSYTATDPGVTAKLVGVAGGGWSITNHIGARMDFNADGQLTKTVDERGFGTTLAYTGSRISTITDTLGQKLTLTWNTATTPATIAKVQGSEGSTVTYAYTQASGAPRLSSTTGIDGKTTTYGYDSGTGFLNSITDPAGKISARTTYDPVSKRAVSQLDANGDETRFSWDEATSTATITNPEGNVRKDIYQGNVIVAQVDELGRAIDVYYDDRNNPIAESGTGQDLTTSEYDAAGNLIKRTPPPVAGVAPTSETWTYDAKNKVTSHTDLRGGTTTYTYDAAGNQTSETDATGATTTWTYNTLGLPLTVTDPLGAVTTMEYSPVGDLTKTVAPGGATTTYTWDARHNLTSQTDPRGNVTGVTAAEKEKYTTHFTYDEFGRVLTTTDPLDHVTTNTYDDLGQLTSVTEPNGGVTRFTYDDLGRQLTTTNEYGHTTTNSYDKAGNLTTVTAPNGAKITSVYNAKGQVTATTAPLGNVDGADAATKKAHTILYEYDTAGNQTAVRSPDPSNPGQYLTSSTQFDARNRPVAAVDPLGATTLSSYDQAGNVLTTTDPTGRTETASYDPVGRQTSHTQQGVSISNTYDKAGRLTKTTTGGGRTTTYEYNAQGQLIKETDPRGNTSGANPTDFTTTHEYDVAGNRISSTDPLGRTTRTYVNAVSAPTKLTDPAGKSTSYGYDSSGNVNKVTTATGAITQYAYDKIGRLTRTTNPRLGETVYDYDNIGHLTTVTTPGAKTTRHEYDLNGNRTKTVMPDGEIRSSYNTAGQLTAVDYNDNTPDLSMTYDKAGRPTQVTNGTTAATYTYDPAGKPTTITRGTSSFNYAWDSNGRLVERKFPDGRAQTYSWAEDSLLGATGMTTNGATQTSTYTYDPAGSLTSTARSNGPTTKRTYDKAGQLTALQTLQGTTSTVNQSLTWTPAGQPNTVTTTQSGSTRSIIYGYDDDNRLTSTCSPTSGTSCTTTSPKTTYGYDGNGNRTTLTDPTGTTTSTYNADDQLTEARTSAGALTSYTYSPNGDLATQTGPAGTRTFDYGLDGNLYTVGLEDSRTIAYAYDESGNRTTRRVNGTVDASWIWDTNAPHAVRIAETGTTARRWFEDPQAGLGTAALEVSSTGVPTWLVADFQGSITGTIKTAGLTGTAKYGAFGEEQPTTGSMSSQPLQYQGQYKDNLTGLYDMRLRDYNPVTGTFTNTDPVAPSNGTPFASTYHFAYNHPTTLSDPSGACPWCIVGGAAAGAIIGGVAGGIAEASSGGNFWKGAAQGAVAGGVTGALVGAIGPAGVGVAQTLLVGAGAGAVGNMAGGATGRAISGERQTAGAFTRDAAWGAAGGAAGGGIAVAGSAAFRSAAGSVGGQKIATYLATKMKGLPPAHRPDDLSIVRCPEPASAPTTTPLSKMNRTGSALKGDIEHRSPSWVVDDPAAVSFPLRGTDGRQRELYQLTGGLNEKKGVFEWIVDSNVSEPVITHQRFIPGGTINGVPNQKRQP